MSKYPQIPDPSTVEDPGARETLSAMKQVVEAMTGARGDNPMVSASDLQDLGLAEAERQPIPGGSLSDWLSGGGWPTLTTPPRPGELEAAGGFSTIIVSWRRPEYTNHSHTEVWRSQQPDVGSATMVGTTTGRIYADAVTGDGFYYWARHVSTPTSPAGSGVTGEYAGPVFAQAGRDPDYVMGQLTSGDWEAGTAVQAFQYIDTGDGWVARVTRGGITGDTEPTWPQTEGAQVEDGTVLWVMAEDKGSIPFAIGQVDGEPAVVMRSAFIGDLTVTSAKFKDGIFDNLTAAKGKMKRANIDVADVGKLVAGERIVSAGYDDGEPGFELHGDGRLRLRSGTTGGRMENDGSTISVFDESDQVRVKIGRL